MYYIVNIVHGVVFKSKRKDVTGTIMIQQLPKEEQEEFNDINDILE